MVIVYGFVSLLGGLISCVLLWPYGATIALLSIPFGGSLSVLLVAIFVYLRASGETPSNGDRASNAEQPQRLRTIESRL
jgi:hypothetical protein